MGQIMKNCQEKSEFYKEALNVTQYTEQKSVAFIVKGPHKMNLLQKLKCDDRRKILIYGGLFV